MTQADSVHSTPPTNTPVDTTRRFETLKDAEDALTEQGFKLVPDTCNWINADGIDAGVYPEEAYGISKYWIEYRALDATPTRRPMAQADSNHTTKTSALIHDPLTKPTHESNTGERGGMSMSSVTRRLAMNMIVTAAAASTLIPSTAVTSEADPILNLIENHKRANAELDVALKDLVPGTLSPDPAKEEFYGTRESDVRRDLAATIPMTLARLLAKLKYVEGVGEGKFSSSGRPDECFDEDDLKMILISAQDCVEAHLNSLSS